MQRVFVDTNYFLRFIVKDNAKQYIRAKDVFLKGAKGEIEIFTSMVVFFEVFWVLGSVYKQKKERLCDILHKILKMSFVELPERESLSTALDIYRVKNLDFEDCYNLVYSVQGKATGFMSFDKKLKKEVGK